MELKPWNIHVANINPTFMNTPIISNGQASHIKNFEAAPTEIKEQYGETVPKDIPLTEVCYSGFILIFDIIVIIYRIPCSLSMPLKNLYLINILYLTIMSELWPPLVGKHIIFYLY